MISEEEFAAVLLKLFYDAPFKTGGIVVGNLIMERGWWDQKASEEKLLYMRKCLDLVYEDFEKVINKTRLGNNL